MSRRLLLIRFVVVLTSILGLNYVVWRWLFSVNWDAWWIAVPLVLAETYSLVDSLLFGLGMWRLKERDTPAPPGPGLTVDVFVATYNEPIDLVMTTARAAKAISYPHETWILDDGNRPEMRAAAEAEGIGWITRSAEWAGMPRHAKAGNLNNALLTTEGEFLLILDADMIPEPEILDHTLGFFTDERMALVQTPQYFTNVPEDDPLGSQAPLFYGPIQQGKDGWNSAFFCGSNAVIRREALMQLGVSRYVGEVEVGVHRALKTARAVLRSARRTLEPDETEAREALDAILHEIGCSRRELARGGALFDVTYTFQKRVAAIRRGLVAADLEALQADLAVIAELEGIGADPDLALATVDESVLLQMAHRDWSPLGAVETVQALVNAIDVDRGDEAQAVMPMATISVTEDMATCMRLHTLGWRSAYHDEVLATGLAPEDLQTMLTQRLRWAQGTVQVLFKENPLTQRGLTLAQRLMYFSTMWSYLSGFAALVYIAAPVIYLTLGVLPVNALSTEFFVRLIPFLIINQLLFFVVADGRKTWRGQQYSLALFPVWIASFTTAFGNVFLGRSLDFAVTPKTKREPTGPAWHLIRPQLWAMGLLVGALVAGSVRMATGQANIPGSLFNMVWVVFDLLIFSVIIKAARYRGYVAPSEPAPTTVSVGPTHQGAP
ncbi:cellulose synthase [Nocardioides psychrotolerans]|uniref:Cellulose synthase (UDP-forming) n=1 Tax=Nocardioides psychrotolerans TaxID=1005945 RepID=A0A1I3FVH0_9ACTN|nr:glycosyltransferase family 2 protein [Nocardioides psychrotolerans]GEP37333.1 cellulose synthase [Nocardioides psychrotolerans]SFI15250.1 cellulose synthase (UDP-forming) [Nocardioides psychrotolerans]